jgi:hypothetical protein
VRVRYRSDSTGKTLTRPLGVENICAFQKYDLRQIVRDLEYKPEFPIPKDWDRRYEDKLYEKGVACYSDFFTERNYALNGLIFNDIMRLRGKTGSRLNEYLYFLFSSSLRYTNKMVRVTDNWEGGKPTAMDKHAFWLPNQYVETNILDVLRQRAGAILRGCEYAASVLPKDIVEVESFEDIRLRSSYMVLNRSAASLPVPDESVDAVITDPPYGSNVQYAELSVIWNAWYAIYRGLDRCVYKEEEAVVSRKSNYKGAKDESFCTKYIRRAHGSSSRAATSSLPSTTRTSRYGRRCSRRWRGPGSTCRKTESCFRII